MNNHPIFRLIGKTVSGVYTSNFEIGDDEASGLTLHFDDGTTLELSENYVECCGWGGITVELSKNAKED